ncbi:MAG: substrate-binding domain-containing protein [Myxococcota bacterium]
MIRHALVLALTTLLLMAAPLVHSAAEPGAAGLILATTTSVRDSGLLDTLLPAFSKSTGIRVQVIAVGTGAALRMGREGNADVLLTHAPAAEQVLVDEGIVLRRTPFMENFFVIAGPAADPAKVAEAKSPEAAIAQIARKGARWVSRDDDSGTHKREKQLFEAAGLDPDGKWKGLARTGSGMGLSLQVAGERRAYILSDIGTFLAFKKRTGLVALSSPSASLRNTYSVLQLNPKRFDHALSTGAAEALEQYLLSEETQQIISKFGLERFGRTLFSPLHLPPAEAAETPKP